MALFARLMTWVLLVLGVASLTSATVRAQAARTDVTVSAHFADDGIVDRDITCLGAGDSGVSSGDVDALAFEGWTWERVDGHSLKIYDETGKHVMTLVGAGNTSNTSGAITDGSSRGDWGGRWTR